MTKGALSGPPGSGRVVPLREAEHELRMAWRALDDFSRREHGEGMLRLREVNLVVMCREEDLAVVQRTATLITREHPARVLVVVDTAGAAEAAPAAAGAAEGGRQSTASIVTACLVDQSSGHHVCSEEVLIRSGEGDRRALRAAVLQLLVQDVPVVGWWFGDVSNDLTGLEWLSGICDQVVTDLSQAHDPGIGIRTLASLAGEGEVWLRDLEWSRITRWRVLTAELFGQAENLNALSGRVRVTVEHHLAPVQALLYGAWFCSRLGLSASPQGWWTRDDALCLELRRSTTAEEGPGGAGGSGDEAAAPHVESTRLLLEVVPVDAAGREHRGLVNIRIRSDAMTVGEDQLCTDAGRRIDLERSPLSRVCSARVAGEGTEMMVKSVQVGDDEDFVHMGRVIDTPSGDGVFHATLSHAAEMVAARGFGQSTWSSTHAGRR